MKLITFDKAKKEVERLQEYIQLVEGYTVDSTEKWIIKEYALTNSLRKVVSNAVEKGITNNGLEMDYPFVVSVVNSSKVSGELHRLLRLGYRKRVKANKGKDRY